MTEFAAKVEQIFRLAKIDDLADRVRRWACKWHKDGRMFGDHNAGLDFTIIRRRRTMLRIVEHDSNLKNSCAVIKMPKFRACNPNLLSPSPCRW